MNAHPTLGIFPLCKSYKKVKPTSYYRRKQNKTFVFLPLLLLGHSCKTIFGQKDIPALEFESEVSDTKMQGQERILLEVMAVVGSSIQQFCSVFLDREPVMKLPYNLVYFPTWFYSFPKGAGR